ncbi:MAG: hypothetical protein HFG27_08415 [Provencibacterium sp.]|nr:hypothetical protein [Provencibacterium sp.]
MINPPVEGHVVSEFFLGATRVKICDDYCRDKTPEDVQAILQRIAENAYRAFQAAAEPIQEETA